MGKWTLDKELEDTAKAGAAGMNMSRKANRYRSYSETPQSASAPNPANPDGMSNNQVESGMRYARGGAVQAPFSPPMGGGVGASLVHRRPSRADMGVATIGVTRSNRSYPKGK